MSLQKLVCPNEPEMFNRLSSRVLAVRVDDAAEVASAASDVNSSGNLLLCVILETDAPLAALNLREEWTGIPLALFAPETGRFRDLRKGLELLRKLNVRVYLPARNNDNLSGLRILASVGVPGCITFEEGGIDWDALADLMTYAVLGLLPHAPIDPFVYIAEHYDPLQYTEWGSVWFDDPKKFLHLDNQGRVALSQEELMAGRFIAEDILELENPLSCQGYVEKITAWRSAFREDHDCSRCPGWRVCLGRFAANGEPLAGCTTFFSEMMEVAEQYQAQRAEANSIWQP